MVKATASLPYRTWEPNLKTEKQNYVVNTKDILSLAMELVMLLGHTNYLTNIRREKTKQFA